jgi:ABC-type sugar transport system permease subunit
MVTRVISQSTAASSKSRRRRDISPMGVIVGLAILGYFIALFVIPFGRAIWLSFHNWDFIVDPTYVGLRNYRKAIDDNYFWQALRVTLYFAAARIVLSLVLAFFVALGVSQLHSRFRNVFIGLFYIPVVVPGVVSILLWKWLYLPTGGAFNSLLARFGIPEQPFLNSSSQALWCIVALSIWSGVGSAIIIFYAGINDVPGDLLEAAELDGAGLWKKTTGIILPMMKPVMFYEIVVGIIGAVQAFEVFYLMSGPGFSTRTLTLYTYELGFKSLNLGYGATISMFIFMLLLVATVFQFRRFMAAQQSN